MNNDRNDRIEQTEDERKIRNQTMTRSRTSTGEISNDEIDDDAMERDEEMPRETTRGELGAGE